MGIYSRKVIDRTGVHHSTKCKICRITASKFSKGVPVDTGINHPEYGKTLSFYQYKGNMGKIYHICAKCHREHVIKHLFDLMDKNEKKYKQITKCREIGAYNETIK